MTQNRKIKTRTCFSAALTPGSYFTAASKSGGDSSQSSALCCVPVGSGGISYQELSTRIPPNPLVRAEQCLLEEVMWVWISRSRTGFSSPTKGGKKKTRGEHLDSSTEGKICFKRMWDIKKIGLFLFYAQFVISKTNSDWLMDSEVKLIPWGFEPLWHITLPT